jgi:uncharacterized protein (TIGR00251 family)
LAVIRVRVTPRSTRERIAVDGDEVHIWVNSPPVEGRANERVVAMLAKALDCAKSTIAITGGARSRWKTVAIEGWDASEIMIALTSGADRSSTR